MAVSTADMAVPKFAAPVVPRSSGVAAVIAPAQEARFVAADLRRVGVLLLSLVGLELVLWYLMGHTSLGTTIYNLIQV